MPERFKDRLFYQHNATVTLMRTTLKENSQIGREIGRKLAVSSGPAAIVLPLNCVSAIDVEGQALNDRHARRSLFDAIRQGHEDTEFIEVDHHINDAVLAEAAALQWNN